MDLDPFALPIREKETKKKKLSQQIIVLFDTMQKHKENLFSEKFRLLNSQENVEDITWSSSDTSDVENVYSFTKCSNLSSKRQRKRKRQKTGPKNSSNLCVTILDTSKNHNKINTGQISPVLQRKEQSKVLTKSPTFLPTPKYRPHKCMKSERLKPTSPILTCKIPTTQSRVLIDKSPILQLKISSPKASPKIKKKLFHVTQDEPIILELMHDECEEKKLANKSLVHRRKSEAIVTTSNTLDSASRKSIKIKHEKGSQSMNIHQSFEQPGKVMVQPHSSQEIMNTAKIKIEIPEYLEEVTKISQQCIDTHINTPNSDIDKKTKQSYFESHFSSENTLQTQHSISDCPTPNNYSKSSDDIDIVSIGTQLHSNKGSFQSNFGFVSNNPSPVSSQSAEFGAERSKKIRYKKDGLAYRLSALLKKQSANISLWQHERFLADNSNFVIPKGEHVVFLIQKVSVKFGCYLLECIDIHDSNVLIIISSVYVQESNISQNMVFKLYEPYKILDYNENCMIIVNVCKFECNALKESFK